MRLNRPTDYAIRIRIYLAKEASVVSSAKLSGKVGMSPRYLLQIGAKLRNAELITTTYGSSGGFSIKRPADEISLYDIITAMEGGIAYQISQKHKGSKDIKPLDEIYKYMDDALIHFLKGITIAELLPQSEETEI